jgi:transcriptional regulator with XRE-family HTH domain
MNLAGFGETFKRARILANKTQQEVADYSGVSRARISLFETGGLPELGSVKLLSLFEAVGLELLARPAGHGRTLDDVLVELDELRVPSGHIRSRVRHLQRRPGHDKDVDSAASDLKPSTTRGHEGST